MAKGKKMPPKKKGKGVDVMIAVAPAGKMGGKPPMPPMMTKGKAKGNGTCPECGGKMKNGVCPDCGYTAK